MTDSRAVKIALDIAIGAIRNEYDACYLLSSDTDLIPAIKIAKEERKKVVYVGFKNFESVAMSRNCTNAIIVHDPTVF